MDTIALGFGCNAARSISTSSDASLVAMSLAVLGEPISPSNDSFHSRHFAHSSSIIGNQRSRSQR